MTDLLESKKFRAALAATIVAILGKFGLDIPEGELLAILSPILLYVAAQGVADIGKPRAEAILNELEAASSEQQAREEISEEMRP